MGNIKVLWMNNGEEFYSSLISDALEYGINIVSCKNFTDCRNLLSSRSNLKLTYDAVLLNANCRMTSEKPKLDNLGYALDWLHKYSSRIPYFIVLPKDIKTTDKTKLKRVSSKLYSLQESTVKLLDDVRDTVKEMPHFKYAKELDFCQEQERLSLSNLLWKLQENVNDIGIDHTIPNDCRKVLEGIQYNLIHMGNRVPNIKKGILSDSIKDQMSLNDFSRTLGESTKVPEYVKRSFHRCCSVTQESSHLLGCDELIKKGKAPYLNISLIYDLLNILYWCATLKEEDYV